MLIIFQIIFFLFGLLILGMGRIGLGEGGVQGWRARLSGLVLMLPFIISLGLLALNGGEVESNSAAEESTAVYVVIDIAIMTLALVGVVALVMTAPPASAPSVQEDDRRLLQGD